MVTVSVDDDKDVFLDLADRADAEFAVGAPVIDSLNGGAIEDASSVVEAKTSLAQVLAALGGVPFKFYLQA